MMESCKDAVKYYDNDFEWAQVAAERQDRCNGASAPPIETGLVLEDMEQRWEEFYKVHEHKFFKFRTYMLPAFPILQTICEQDERQVVDIFELGCGTGSALIPLMKKLPKLRCHGFDVSASAIQSMNELVAKEGLHDRCEVFVCDAVKDDYAVPDHSMDLVLMVFTLSAIHPDQHLNVLWKAFKLLKPGGYFLFRDYGLYDMVQARCETRIGENQYIKQDGIQCYFFSLESMQELMKQLEEKDASFATREHQLKYCTVRNVNHKKKINIDRVFLNAVWQKHE